MLNLNAQHVGRVSADDILEYLSYFPHKIGFDITCKLSSKETICMKFQVPFSGNNKKNTSACRLLN